MAFVDDDQIEKVERKLLVDVFVFFRSSNGFVETEIDFLGLDDRSIRDFGHCLAERLEIVNQRQID